MDKIDIQGLECTICLNTINDPKLLSCSHTFCKACLEDLSETQPDGLRLPCPVCKKVTAVPNGEVGQLQTYTALQQVVDDMKNKRHVCTICESDDPPLAESYCQDCRKWMCEMCQTVHSQWKSFARHQVVGPSDVDDGKISLKRRSTCPKHPSEDAECFCAECCQYICFCAVLEHTRKGHQILQADEHEGELKVNIEELQTKAEVRKTTINKYIAFIEEQQEQLKGVHTHLTNSIDSAYEESVNQLTQRKEALMSEVKSRLGELEISLKGMQEKGLRMVVQVNAASDLVSHGIDAPLEKEALQAHNTLCEELQGILERDNPDYKHPTMIAKRGEKVLFERNSGANELNLGRIQVSEWVVKNVDFPNKNTITAMAATPDGVMALGSNTGGVDMFTIEGTLQKSVLRNLKIREIEFMSDGRYVLRDKMNTVTVYSRTCELLNNIRFDTMRYEDAGVGDLAVDARDNIYVGYRKARTIQVFKPTGGRSFREIPCDGYEPSQVFSLKTKSLLLVQSHSNSVRLIDHNGAMMHDVTLYDNVYAYPAVCQDDSVIIAWVKHDDGLVTIDQYTNELKHVTTLIADHKIEKPDKRHWYYLQEFTTGEIAFCTPDKMYIFKQSVAMTNL